jgi:hypothetical protein
VTDEVRKEILMDTVLSQLHEMADATPDSLSCHSCDVRLASGGHPVRTTFGQAKAGYEESCSIFVSPSKEIPDSFAKRVTTSSTHITSYPAVPTN